jgi:hypothetical protein
MTRALLAWALRAPLPLSSTRRVALWVACRLMWVRLWLGGQV